VNHDPIDIGDIVIFKSDNPAFKMGYVLWAGPDYEETSLEVKSIMRPGDIMLVLYFSKERNNAFLMLHDGTTGWSKTTVLEKL
jgi:hypothetical protein